MTGTHAPARSVGLAGIGLSEVGDHGWVYTFGELVFELADSERGWHVRSGTGAAGHQGQPRWFDDPRRAEHEFFHTVATTIVAARPCLLEQTIGGARLVIVRAGDHWHVAEASADPWACAYANEEDARRAWLTRGIELLKQIAGECGYYG